MYYKDHYKLKFEFPEGVYSTDTFDIRELNDRLFDCNIFHSTLDSKEAKIQILYERTDPVSYTHLRAHETVLDLVCRLLLEKKKENTKKREQKLTQERRYKTK